MFLNGVRCIRAAVYDKHYFQRVVKFGADAVDVRQQVLQ